MTRIRVRHWLWVVVMVALVAASCGSESDTTAPSSTASSTTESSTTSSSTTATSTTATSPTMSSTTSTATSSTTIETPAQTVVVYFSEGDGSDCAEVGSYERTLPTTVDPITAAFDALVEGPTDDEAASGAGSFFSADTTGLVRSTVLIDGLLVVDLHDRRELLNNASTSCGSEAFLAQLTATAFQFERVDQLMLQMDGSCDLVMNWLQRECQTFRRDGSTPLVALELRADGSGCMPGQGDLPDGRWFGYIDAASEAIASFDLACWFTGSVAIEAAALDGEESPPPNDYHIRNEFEAWRDIPVAADVRVSYLPVGDPASAIDIPYTEWLTDRYGRDIQPGLWLTIADGIIVELEEQYQP